jgi:predicted TIM-barrel fold metal-dependent hydrolase
VELMLSRRAALIGTGALGAWMTALYSYSTGLGVGGRNPKVTANFEVPSDACDSHVHVIGDPRVFPMSSQRDNTPPPATADQLQQMLQFLTLSRVVIVSPGIYTDNLATIAAIRQLGQDRARGVGWLPETRSSDVLGSMKEAGIVGFRVFLYEGGLFKSAVAADRLRAKFDVAERLGWHLDISAPPNVIAALLPELDASPVPLVFDYFGWLAGGVHQYGSDAVLSLVKSGRSYVKLSEPYRLSKSPNYADLVPVVRALVEANPDRVLWGSGWPHVSGARPGQAKEDLAPHLPIDAGHLLNLLAEWVPHAETRRKILVDNPARLYGF